LGVVVAIPTKLRVALVQDWLVSGSGGAERVVDQLHGMCQLHNLHHTVLMNGEKKLDGKVVTGFCKNGRSGSAQICAHPAHLVV